MAALVWISGASSGIGRALVDSVPWPSARVIGISRRPAPPAEHLAADLSNPSSWDLVNASFQQEAAGATGDPPGTTNTVVDTVVFVHAAGSIQPMGFAADVAGPAYRDNVVLNSASPQVLGAMFLAAAARWPGARRHLVLITSGAARSVYPGWSSYGAAKAAVDQWVRNAGAEQDVRGGVQVVAVAPGTVDTGMQAVLRATPAADFPQRQKFLDLYQAGKLTAPAEVAAKIWRLLDAGLANGSVVDLRDLPA